MKTLRFLGRVVVVAVTCGAVASSPCVCNDGLIVCESKGRLYAGGCADEARHGFGVHQFSDGAVFIGTFNRGHMTGHGFTRLASGDEQLGEFHMGKLSGHGEFTWKSGQQYWGQWKEGKRDGYGKLVASEDVQFEGQWVADRMDGFGVLTVAGDQLAGEFAMGELVNENKPLPAGFHEALAVAVQTAEAAKAQGQEAKAQGEAASDLAHERNPPADIYGDLEAEAEQTSEAWWAKGPSGEL